MQQMIKVETKKTFSVSQILCFIETSFDGSGGLIYRIFIFFASLIIFNLSFIV